jgi:tetratricopeptide (TPR) repeat protein
MENINVQAGIEKYKSGDKANALKIFLEILKQEPNNEIAWLWLAACVEKPEQKKDCFHKVLSINPNNTFAQKALAELELQTVPQSVSDVKPVAKNGSVLKCPSCGSVMGQPDHTGLVQCGYCGTTITYHPPVEKTERKNVERLLEICKAAIDGGNYNEGLQYSNKILEIDPDNFDAWVYKAISAFWQTTVANNKYDEAMGYLNKAERIDQNNPRIQEMRKYLIDNQIRWFVHLGDEQITHGVKIYNIYATQYDLNNAIVDSLLGSPDAKENSREYFVKAMDYFLSASSYAPEGYLALSRIRDLANSYRWINWSSQVREKVNLVTTMEQKGLADMRLPELQKELQENMAKLKKLNKEGGFFIIADVQIEILKSKIRSLEQEIERCEKIAGVSGMQRNLDIEQVISISKDEAQNGADKTIGMPDDRFTVKIPVGVKDGTKIQVKGKGEKYISKGITSVGDLYLVVSVRER